MRPISLRFKCFGPYMDEQYIDFDDLRTYGIFLISGKTGTGKTTILDAMCVALFGEASGGTVVKNTVYGNRGGIVEMRCKLAKPEQETYVEFVFENAGEIYKFYRELKFKKTKYSETNNCMKFEDGVYVPVLSNPTAKNVNNKAEEILQLSSTQFRQIVILPQGQFEKLLISPSSEKQEILTKVFHADRWGRLAENIKKKVAAEEEEVKRIKNEIDTILKTEDVDSLEALEGSIKELQDKIKELTAQETELKNAEKKAFDAYTKALEENKDFEERDKTQVAFNKLLAKEEAMKEEEEFLIKAEKADEISSVFNSLNEERIRVKEAENSIKKAEQVLLKRKDEERSIKEAQKRIESEKTENENRKTNLTLMINAQGSYENLFQKEEAVKKAETVVKKAEAERKKRETAKLNADKEYDLDCKNQKEITGKLRKALEIYDKNSAARLAKDLVEGEPCLVCGSKVHPRLAVYSNSESKVTDEMVSELNKAWDQALSKMKNSENNKKEAETLLKKSDDELLKSKEILAKAQAELEASKESIIPGIDSLETLNSQIRKVQNEIEAFENSEKKIQEDVLKVEKELSGAESSLKENQKSLQDASEKCNLAEVNWKNSLAQKGFDSEDAFRDALTEKTELSKRKDALTTYKADFVSKKKELSEREEKVKNRVAPEIGLLKEEHENAKKEQEIIGKECNTANRDMEKKKTTKQKVGKLLANKEEKNRRFEADKEFLDKILPKTGVSLQRYVLGIMFGTVIDAANNLLESVHGGRYKLQRTDESTSSGNISGLDLLVFDTNNGETRAATTLSGGEKFLVALSLAIGLSTVVQNQSHGIRLEAMFVDEGFGSLDEDSIDEAVGILQTVQRGNGVVGVISHVKKLKTLLPYTLEIKESRSGNNITGSTWSAE